MYYLHFTLRLSLVPFQKYFQSSAAYKSGEGESELMFEWTNQHGCGGNEDTDPHKQNCNLVLQFMCTEDNPNSATGMLNI